MELAARAERLDVDRRVQRTRQLLQDALIALILEKEYEKITMQNIITPFSITLLIADASNYTPTRIPLATRARVKMSFFGSRTR